MGARLVSGDTCDIFVPAAASVAFHVGDMTYLASNVAQPAVAASANANAISTAQESLHDVFLGVSKDGKASTDTSTGKICIGTRGRYVVPCKDEAAAAVGTFMGGSPVADANSTNLASQKVEVVATANLAVGRLTKLKAANATECEIEITGFVNGGPQTVE